MKTVLFDLLGAQPLGGTKFHGGGEYIKIVFVRLAERVADNDEVSLKVYFDSDKFLDDYIHEIIKRHNIEHFDIKGHDELNKLLQSLRSDVYFSGLPYSSGKLSFPDNVYKIGTMHGLRFLELPQSERYAHLYLSPGLHKAKSYIKYCARFLYEPWFQKKNIIKYGKTAHMLDKVVTGSLHSKYSIVTFLDVCADDIAVLYPPSPSVLSTDSVQQPELLALVEGKYALMISVNRSVKNAYRCLQAFELLFSQGKLKDYKVVLTGNLPKTIKSKLRHLDRYVFLGYVQPQQLEALYAHCDFFVYGSLNEGFGLPPLEAMKYGKTCIVSAVASLPEVYGDSVYYFNPYDIYEIRNRIMMAVDIKIDKAVIQQKVQQLRDKINNDTTKLINLILNTED